MEYFLAKRALFIASKHCGQIQYYSNGIRSSRACFYNERSDQGLIKDRETRDQTETTSKYDHNVENMSGVEGFAAGMAVGTARTAENMGEMAKETMDKAWDSAKNATRDLQDTVVAAADENVVDTTEYRTIIDLKNSVEPHDQEGPGI